MVGVSFANSTVATQAKLAHLGTIKAKKSTASWDGSSIGLGVEVTTGNSNTSSYNAQASLIYSKNKWTNDFSGNYQRGSADDVLNADNYSVSDQLQYQFDGQNKNKSFVFLNSTVEGDNFSPVRMQSLNIAGYGYRWVKTDQFSLSTQLGPGYRRNRDDEDVVRSSPIASFGLTLIWKITKAATLSEKFQNNYGSQYNNWSSDTAVTNKLIGNLALQVEYIMKYYSRIPAISANTKKLDTKLTVNILYSF